MELSGCSIEKRNIQKECKTASEIIRSVICDHFWGIFSSYVFGSQYEGTWFIGMGSDEDIVFVFNKLEVVTNSQNFPETCLLLVQDDSTPPGYCKLQLVLSGAPVTFHNINSPTMLSGICKFEEKFTSPHTIDMDLHGRLLIGRLLLEHGKWSFQREFHGPAMQGVGIKGKVFDVDMVPAFQCRCLPKDAMQWFTRKRQFGWPPQEVIEQCKQLGFLVVPVGHPNSKEKYKEWRISLSQQERLLVTLFNSVQLKCFVLMKVLKNEVINNKLKRKI